MQIMNPSAGKVYGFSNANICPCLLDMYFVTFILSFIFAVVVLFKLVLSGGERREECCCHVTNIA